MLLIFDLLSLWVIWIGYSEFQRIPLEISNQVDTISFGNRMGFATMGVAIPLIHFIVIIEKFRPAIVKECTTILNTGICVMIAVLIVAGFACSSWLEFKVENAGYIYCRRASGVSAISKTLVFTKDMKICEDLIEKKMKRRRTGKW